MAMARTEEERPLPSVKVVQDYQIDINPDDNEMRIVFHDDESAVARVMTSDEAYLFAQRILRGYDQLEGL